ncbi:hypothetical protein KKA15_04355 [Patescibacteria group bacterium]|nr:hypothetical protein [Patescibacteria group bacterium]
MLENHVGKEEDQDQKLIEAYRDCGDAFGLEEEEVKKIFEKLKSMPRG